MAEDGFGKVLNRFLLRISRKKEKKIHSHVLFLYFIKELLIYFSAAFVFFFLIFFVNQILLVAENILRKHVPVWTVVKLITYGLPFIIAQSAPFATLVGFLMCLGRFMSDNEILMLRATGNSYFHLVVPVLLLGFVISILSFFVNDYLLPVGSIRYNRLYRSILASNPSVALEPNSVKRTNDSILVVGDVSDKTVSDLVFFGTDDNKNQRIIVAGHTNITAPKNLGVVLQLDMDNPEVLLLDKKKTGDYTLMSADKILLNIFESAFFENKGVSPNEMTSSDLRKKLEKLKKDSTVSSKQLNRYELEYNKKFSLPFGSIFFAILAIPLAILFGKRNGQTIGLIIGIILCVIYWALMIVGQILSSRNGFNGVVTMWLPDLLVGCAGGLLYFKMVKR